MSTPAQRFPFSQERRDAFLLQLKVTGAIATACEIAGVSYSTVRRAAKEFEDFRDEIEFCTRLAAEKLEIAAFQRAISGTPEPILNPRTGEQAVAWGGAPLVKIKHSDALAIKLLEGGIPEKYSRKTSQTNVQVNNDNRTQVGVLLAPAPAESIESWLGELQALPSSAPQIAPVSIIDMPEDHALETVGGPEPEIDILLRGMGLLPGEEDS